MSEQAPIEVVLSPDGLTAALRAPPGRDRSLVSPGLCDALLREAGVRTGAVDRVEVLAFVDRCAHAEKSAVVEATVARGTPPTHGEQGSVNILERFAPSAPQGGAGAEQAVDHHARSRFIPVHAGEKIGFVFDSTPGTEGLSVRGAPVAARPGPPPAMRVHDSIERRGSELFARFNGCLIVGETIVRVVEQVEIPGFVDFSTGNIDLPCDLLVEKGVRDEFVVRVGGSATVRGLVEAAILQTGRDAMLDGGMAARAKGRLEVGRDLRAKYLDNVPGHVMRDAQVRNEIVNCDLAIGRSLLAPTGQIIGGRVMIAVSGEIDTVGSEANVPTEVAVGRAPRAEDLLGRAHDLRGRVDARLQKSEREHTQLSTLSGPKLTAQQAERTTELQYELSLLRGCATRIDTACKGLSAAVRGDAQVRLQVNGRIYPGVTVRIGAYTAKFRRDLRGPVAILFNDRGVPIVENLLDGSIQRLKEVALVERDEDAITLFDPPAAA